MVLEIGEPGPELGLESDTGETIALETLRGQRAVLFCYPRDNTPG